MYLLVRFVYLNYQYIINNFYLNEIINISYLTSAVQRFKFKYILLYICIYFWSLLFHIIFLMLQ